MEAALRLGLTQGSPDSPILFAVYINDIYGYDTHHEYLRLWTNGLGKVNIKLTSDEVIIHGKSWAQLRLWLDRYTKWAFEKQMKLAQESA